jgi:hypothetical protein
MTCSRATWARWPGFIGEIAGVDAARKRVRAGTPNAFSAAVADRA